MDAGIVPKSTIDPDDLVFEDYKLRELFYKQSRKLLATLNDKAETFDPSAVSDFLHFLVAGVNYSVASRRASTESLQTWRLRLISAYWRRARLQMTRPRAP